MAKSLIEEIQHEAVNREAPVSSLLRKAKLAAAKLKLEKIEAWVDDELKGYTCEADKLPKYRQVRGALKIWNPYYGWQPLGGDFETLDHLSQVYMWDPIASFENIPREKKGGVATYPYTPVKLEILSKLVGTNISRAGVDISHGAVFAVLDAVRTLVLEWAIDLEKAGETGEGMSFSNEDREMAQASAGISMQIGTIGNFTGILGAHNSARDITSSLIER